MRIAIFSDIHGNPIALDAVLADIETQGGADEVWVLGGLAAIGPDPAGALDRLAKLPNARFIRGNTDRYLVTGERPPPYLQDVAADIGLLPVLVEVSQAFSWSQGAVAATGWHDWLARLPLEQRLTLPDGTRLLGVHAAPGTDDGDGISPALDDAELGEVVAGCEADLVCVGHTHWPLDRSAGGVRVINPGSVSNPFPPDLRAAYALLEADASAHRIQKRRVDYDREAVIGLAERLRYPGLGYVAGFLRGQIRPRWPEKHAA
jgi:predicted phosphodiesterase